MSKASVIITILSFGLLSADDVSLRSIRTTITAADAITIPEIAAVPEISSLRLQQRAALTQGNLAAAREIELQIQTTMVSRQSLCEDWGQPRFPRIGDSPGFPKRTAGTVPAGPGVWFLKLQAPELQATCKLIVR
jgi:hypothetical protein